MSSNQYLPGVYGNEANAMAACSKNAQCGGPVKQPNNQYKLLEKSPASVQQVQTLSAAKQKIDEQLTDAISQYKSYISDSSRKIDAQKPMLGSVAGDIASKQLRLEAQIEAIRQKKELVLTRDRMLQLSIERNVYKRKVIYSVLALILAVIVLMIAGYVTFNK